MRRPRRRRWARRGGRTRRHGGPPHLPERLSAADPPVTAGIHTAGGPPGCVFNRGGLTERSARRRRGQAGHDEPRPDQDAPSAAGSLSRPPYPCRGPFIPVTPDPNLRAPTPHPFARSRHRTRLGGAATGNKGRQGPRTDDGPVDPRRSDVRHSTTADHPTGTRPGHHAGTGSARPPSRPDPDPTHSRSRRRPSPRTLVSPHRGGEPPMPEPAPV